MTRDAIRAFCLALPSVQEKFQFHHAAFQVAGKSFAMLNLEVEGLPLSFKTSPESFAELVEIPGVIPAPYLARNHWVSISDWESLPATELKSRLRESHQLVVSKLSRKLQAELGFG